MSLIDCMMVPCVFMEKKQVPDGSGGQVTTWEDGEPLKAAIVRDASTESRVADATKAVEQYTITVSRSVHLKYHAVIKRLSDGKTFRITSDNAEMKAPPCTALDIAQSTAEAWRLT